MNFSDIERSGSDSDSQTLREKLVDSLIPGFAAECDPEEAQQAGAFIEDALSEADAAESSIDLEGALAFYAGMEN